MPLLVPDSGRGRFKIGWLRAMRSMASPGFIWSLAMEDRTLMRATRTRLSEVTGRSLVTRRTTLRERQPSETASTTFGLEK
jgi:hypothetical protein